RPAVRWARSCGRPNPVTEAQSRNTFVGLNVTGTSGIDDVVRQRGRWQWSTPVPSRIGTEQPVADELFVEAVLHLADAVVGRRPVARRVGGEDLLGQQDRKSTRLNS